MNRRGRYRKFLFWCLGLDVLAMSWLGYRYMDRKVPDEIHVSESSAHEVQELLEHPLLEFEDAITVSGEGSYLLPCRLLGMIPFKDIKVTPAEAGSVYVSGSTVGIYMETEGVLIIDTGEILCEGGTAREPAKNIVRPGDYIVAFNEQKVSNKKELMEDLEILDGEDVILDVIRNGEKIPVSLTPVKDAGGEYKLGIWVRRASEPSPSWTKKAVTAPWVMESVMWIQGSFFISAKGRYIRRRSWVSRKERAEVRENFPGSYAMNPARL